MRGMWLGLGRSKALGDAAALGHLDCVAALMREARPGMVSSATRWPSNQIKLAAGPSYKHDFVGDDSATSDPQGASRGRERRPGVADLHQRRGRGLSVLVLTLPAAVAILTLGSVV